MKASEILQAAKALIDSPEKWTTGVYARDKTGVKTCYSLKNAVSFCSVGACDRVTPYNGKAILFLRDFMGGDISDFNDNHTHAEVMEAWAKAIEMALETEEAPY